MERQCELLVTEESSEMRSWIRFMDTNQFLQNKLQNGGALQVFLQKGSVIFLNNVSGTIHTWKRKAYSCPSSSFEDWL
jgi:hypothetical protein